MCYIILDITKTQSWTSLKHRVREKATSPTASCTHHQKRNEIKTGISGCSSFVVAYFQPATSINRLHGCFWGCCCFVFVLLLLGFLGAWGYANVKPGPFCFWSKMLALAWHDFCHHLYLSTIPLFIPLQFLYLSLYNSSVYLSTIPLFIPLQFLCLSLYNSSIYPSTIPLFIPLQFLCLSLYNSSIYPSTIPLFISLQFLYLSLYNSSIYPSTIPLFISLQFLCLSLYNSSIYLSTIPLFIPLQFLCLSHSKINK